MGWAGTIHQRYGASLVPMQSKNLGSHWLEYRGRHGFGAFESLYEVKWKQAIEICSPAEYRAEFGTVNPNPRQVAKRIRDVLSRIDPAALTEAYPITSEIRQLAEVPS